MSYQIIETTEDHEVRQYNSDKDLKEEFERRCTRGDLVLVVNYNDPLAALYSYVYIKDSSESAKFIKYHQQPHFYQMHSFKVQIRVYTNLDHCLDLYNYHPETDYFYTSTQRVYISKIRTEQLNNKLS